ncbi:MAG: hypothetical protein ACLUES_05400 [Flavonifractor plautii]
MGSGYQVGHRDTIILESCEYCSSFLSFFPTVAVILNIEADPGLLQDLDDVEHSFRAFADRVPGSIIVANADDANTMHPGGGAARPHLRSGAGRRPQPRLEPGLPSFDVVYRGRCSPTWPCGCPASTT